MQLQRLYEIDTMKTKRLRIKKANVKKSVCAICGSEIKGWCARVEIMNYAGNRDGVYCHRECLIGLLKCIFPKSLRIGKKLKQKFLLRMV